MITKELARIQQAVSVPKGQHNAFSNFSYRSAEDILTAVKPHLNGLALIINDSIELVGDRYYVKATATLTNGSDLISTTAYAREELQKKGMDSAQVTGSTSSYARKYALAAMLAIDDGKDADTHDNTEHVSQTSFQPANPVIPANLKDNHTKIARSIGANDAALIQATWTSFDKDTKAAVWAVLTNVQQETVRGAL